MAQLLPVPVRPRVLSPLTGEAILLAEVIAQHLESGKSGVIAILGGPGTGKTTALHYLAECFARSPRLILQDNATKDHICNAESCQLVVYTARQSIPGLFHRSKYRLAPWREDDFIEYLLARHKEQCGSVITRLRQNPRSRLPGIPELWAIVLTQMAQEAGLPDAQSAVRAHLLAQLTDTDLLERARSVCLNAVVTSKGKPLSLRKLKKRGFPGYLLRMLRHPCIQFFLAGERVVADLHGESDCDTLAKRLPRQLVESVGEAIQADKRAQNHLRQLLEGPSWSHAMSVSLLHAAGQRWEPSEIQVADLPGAYLEGVDWREACLHRANLKGTDLTGADLRGANLSEAYLLTAQLRHALLQGANLQGIRASMSIWADADCSAVRAMDARFLASDLSRSRWDGANLNQGYFTKVNLAGASFAGANLVGTTWEEVALQNTDFSEADLTDAHLAGLDLKQTRLCGAVLKTARMQECDLENMDLAGCSFHHADLGRATLTGCRMPGVDLKGARLQFAKLADINWEGANLRHADLRGASFHMGSTRCGHLFDRPPCEGSRTGFYTDEYEEQYFKSPQEIRKANLCGADLRAALIDDVDFYLVDLRGALYDPEQEEIFRRCGAILEARV